MISLDGTAPRAKMNHQRQKRYLKFLKQQTELELIKQTGLTPQKQNYIINSIGPGTEFMATVQEQIEFYIKKRLQENEAFKKVSKDDSVHGNNRLED